MAWARCYASREVLEDIRKKVESGLGPLIGSADEAEGSLKGKAQGAADQLSGFASIVLDWVAVARESIRGEVRDLVQREIADMGLATAKELEALSVRVHRLERASDAGDGHGAKRVAKHARKPPGKGKRKATAKELESLALRVERLERVAAQDRSPARNQGRANTKPKAARTRGTAPAPGRKSCTPPP